MFSCREYVSAMARNINKLNKIEMEEPEHIYFRLPKYLTYQNNFSSHQNGLLKNNRLRF